MSRGPALLDSVVYLAQSTRTCSLRFVPVLCGRSWVIMDFSDTSSDVLEEHNAWDPMLEMFSGEKCTLVSFCS